MRLFHIGSTLLIITALWSCTQSSSLEEPQTIAGAGLAFDIGAKADPMARLNHDRAMLVDPATGLIPTYMRQAELAFARQQSAQFSRVTGDWTSRGPWNIGGRTRAFVIDHSNSNIMLAGAASGGVWKSTDAGASWYKVTTGDANTAVTSLIQDPRPGHELEWYFTTGELSGASHSAAGAFYLGNGVYKSEDGGESWEGIASTQNATPQTFNSLLEGLWRIAIDPSNLDTTELYLASYGAIWRSVNGGDSWSQVLSSNGGGQASYMTDVTVTDAGVVYATLSYENTVISFGLGPNGGVYRSADGIDFTDIRPEDYPQQFGRTVIGVDPSDSDRVYFLAANVDSLSGFEGVFFNGGVQYSALWRYDYLDGDGAGLGGDWMNLTTNLPTDTGIFDDFYPQSGYDLTIAVSPADPNLVLIGGTNLYRSTDGFTSSDNNRFIGGYAEHSGFPDFGIYENHHPDQHALFFDPAAPDVLYNTNDGGVFRSDNILADTVSWISLNQGYLTTQCYGLGIEMDNSSDQIVAGLQDNGNHYVNDADPTANWTLPLNGDGAYTFFAREHDYVLMSIQQGRVFKCELSDSGELMAFERIDPGLEQAGHDFIHPYAMSPNDDGTVYFPYQNKLYVHRGIDTVSVGADYEANLGGWELFADSLDVEGLRITSVSPADDGSERIYLGTNDQKVYRIDDATDLTATWVDITSGLMPGGHIDCIAVDPLDSDKAMAVYTNYNIYSLFYTEDAGVNWEKAAGSLEQSAGGAGNGPSCRWASIHRWHPDSVVFYVGTSVGLYSTSLIDGLDTEWYHESPEEIGNTVVSHVVSRAVDKKVFAGTHGAGVYEAQVAALSEPSSLAETQELQLRVFPNPSSGQIRVQSLTQSHTQLEYALIDAQGRVLRRASGQSGRELIFDINELGEGLYYIRVTSAEGHQVHPFVKTAL